MKKSYQFPYLFDIGNSFVKLCRDGEIIKFEVSNFSPSSFKKELVFFSNVNPMFREEIKSLSNWIDISEKMREEIITDYRTLGSDRVVAIYGARNSIVVDLGSAVTIDIVKENRHLGGYILLGKKKVFESFQKGISHLKIENKFELGISEIPNLSEDALYFGFFHPLATFIENLSKRYNLDILITGGDGEELKILLANSRYEKELLFKNMKKFLIRSTEFFHIFNKNNDESCFF
jgi:type III pantothenate kinase